MIQGASGGVLGAGVSVKMKGFCGRLLSGYGCEAREIQWSC